MTLYFKNKITDQVQSYNLDSLEKLGRALRCDPWEQISENEVPIDLEKLKIEKLKQLDDYIKSEPVKPLAYNKEGCIECEPYNVFLTAFTMGDKEKKVRRLVDKDGNFIRKSTTLSKTDLLNLSKHYEIRKDNACTLADSIENAIKSAKNLEELNKIKITEK